MGKKLAIVSAVLMVFGAAIMLFGHKEAEAKVCFITDSDGNCGSGTISAVDPNADACNQLGYVCSSGTTCTPSNDMISWVSDTFSVNDPGSSSYYKSVKCPLNGNYYVKCPNAFRQSCPSSVYEVSEKSCGSLRGCKCPDSYKYTLDLRDENPNGIKTQNGNRAVLQCTATGGACQDIDSDGIMETDPRKVKFSLCMCGSPYLYPAGDFTEGDTHKRPYKGSDGNDYCIDSSDEEYYAGWDCHYDGGIWYNKTNHDNDCPFGVNTSDKCFNYVDQTWWYHGCRNCDGFYATNLKYVKDDLTFSTGPTGSPAVEGCDDAENSECMSNFVKTGSGENVEYALAANYEKYYTQPTGLVGLQNIWGKDFPKYTYVNCPLNNASAERHYILKCTEPGMRPSTTADLMYNEDGTPVLDDNGQQKHYHNGEACLPVGCEEAVRQILKIGQTAFSSNALTARFVNSYGILLPVGKNSSQYYVGNDNNGRGFELYHFVDGNGDPIVEQFINSRNGGYFRSRISSNPIGNPPMLQHYPFIERAEIRTGGTASQKYGGYSYVSNDYFIPTNGIGDSPNYNNKAIYTPSGMASYYSPLQNNHRYSKRRKAILIEDIDISMQGGISQQARYICSRKPCVANVSGQKQYWWSEDYYTGLGTQGTGNANLCGDGCTHDVCCNYYNNPSCHQHYKKLKCKKREWQDEPYWKRSENPILGNNDGDTHNKCGDVEGDGSTCVSCFAKGYYTKLPSQHPCSFSNQQQPTKLHIEPNATNNCVTDESEGPGNNTRLTLSAAGTLYGKYPYLLVTGDDTHLNYHPDITLQDWDNDLTCIASDKTGDMISIPLGLTGAPIDEYISVKAFYDEIEADLQINNNFKSISKKMLERSCKINADSYQKPKITYTGEYFPADDNNFYYGTVEPNGTMDHPSPDVNRPVMSFKGIDIDLQSNSTTMVRPFEFDDVKLFAKGLIFNKYVTYDFGSTISKSVISADSLDSYIPVTISGSVFVVDTFTNNGNMIIEDTDIGICRLTNNMPMYLTSSSGEHMVETAESTLFDTSIRRACTKTTLTNNSRFVSKKYRYELDNLYLNVYYDAENASCDGAAFLGMRNGDNSPKDITVANKMVLQGSILFKDMNLIARDIVVGVPHEDSVATFVNMNSSVLWLDTSGSADSFFEIFTCSAIGTPESSNSEHLSLNNGNTVVLGSSNYKYIEAREFGKLGPGYSNYQLANIVTPSASNNQCALLRQGQSPLMRDSTDKYYCSYRFEGSGTDSVKWKRKTSGTSLCNTTGQTGMLCLGQTTDGCINPGSSWPAQNTY